MKKSILILSGCVSLLCLSLLAACSKDEEGTNPPDDGGGDNEEEVVDGDDEEDAVLTLSLDSITVDSGAGRQTVELTSNNEWEIDNPSSEWISISPSRGQADTVTLTVEVSSNESYDMREHTFNIVAGTETVSLTVSQRQLGYLDFRLASAGGNIFLDEGGICEVLATTSIEYEIEYTDNGGEWVSLQQTKALEEETLSFLIAEYTGDSQRECGIVFKEVGGDSKDTIHIVQYHDTEVEFEDAEFERYCLERFDEDGDGRIIGREVRDVGTLSSRNLGITSLSGIEAFENLEFLYCEGNELSSLDLSQNKKLNILYCSDNPLINLDVSDCTFLNALFCSNNQLTSLDASGCTSLHTLGIDMHSIIDFNISGCTALQELDCRTNQLVSLDVSGCVSLQYLFCGNNELTSLDVSGCTSLQDLWCDNNKLTSLDVSGCTSLQDLWCDNNKLTSLDVSGCTSLQSLWCYNNELTSLDISGCTSLQILRCYNNELTSLDVSGCTSLQSLYCNSNQLASLDIGGCTSLGLLDCYSNQLASLDVSFCPDLSYFECSENPLQSMTILREQGNRSWMSEIVNEYPDIEIILK